jgi:CheY-like chemotaxis protein
MAVVLVINDDRDMLSVYESILAALGHEPVTRLMLDSGTRTIREVAAEALILDLQQPEEALYGLRVIEEVRQDPELGHLPIILCSGAPQALRSLRPDLDALGVPVVEKPFSITALEAILHTILRDSPEASGRGQQRSADRPETLG